jgi:triacylglycerol lipase
MRTRIVTHSVLRAMSRQHTMDGGSGKERMAQSSIDKGKGKADGGPLSPYHEAGMTDEPLSMALQEAITTNLLPVSTRSSLEESDFNSASPISPPPQAHHSAPLRPKPQRLLSQLTRATLPISTGQYASKDRRVTYGGYFSQGESSQAGRSKPTTATNDDPFPDLDPTTGLPSALRSNSASSNAPSLHLQRTITDLQHSPVKEPSSFLPFNIAQAGQGVSVRRHLSRIGRLGPLAGGQARVRWIVNCPKRTRQTQLRRKPRSTGGNVGPSLT